MRRPSTPHLFHTFASGLPRKPLHALAHVILSSALACALSGAAQCFAPAETSAALKSDATAKQKVQAENRKASVDEKLSELEKNSLLVRRKTKRPKMT